MASYKYSKLENEAQDIRLVTLLPGERDDVIQIRIFHTPLAAPSNFESQSLPLQDIQKTLPPGWRVHKTVEGRVIFSEYETDNTSWTHPDAKFDTEPLDTIPGELVTDYQPKYDALSYTWGSPGDTELISVCEEMGSSNSDGESAMLKVGKNLATALRYLRHSDRSRTIWIDAICINQEDEEERNTQVRRMTNIYTLARTVVVWLGDSTKNSSLAITALAHLGSQLEITTGNHRLRSPNATEEHWHRSWYKLPYDNETWQAIHDFISRPWFERLWIWQEIQLANHRAVMQCGDEETSWSAFRRVILCLFPKKDLPSSDFQERIRFLQFLAIHLRGKPFSYLLGYSAGRKCSDPRDRVYGLLGIAPSGLTDRIRPQYSLSVSKVYQETVLAALAHTKRLELLNLCTLSDRSIEAPSWVPDFSMPVKTRLGANWQFCSGTSRSYTKHIAPDILEVLGIQCARVETISTPASSEPEENLAVIREWLHESVCSDTYMTGDSFLEAFSLTLVGHRLKDRFPVDTLPTKLEWKEKFHRAMMDKSEVNGAKDSQMDTALRFAVGRTFFTTDEGYIGLGLSNIRPGKSSLVNYCFAVEFVLMMTHLLI